MTSLLNNENTTETFETLNLGSGTDSGSDPDTSSYSDSDSDSDSNIRENYNRMVIERQKIFAQTNQNMNQKYEQYTQDSDLEEIDSDTTYGEDTEDSQDLFTAEIDYSKPVQIDDINNINLTSDNLDYIHNKDNHLAMNLFEKKEIYKEYFIVLENANHNANGVFVTIDFCSLNKKKRTKTVCIYEE